MLLLRQLGLLLFSATFTATFNATFTATFTTTCTAAFTATFIATFTATCTATFTVTFIATFSATFRDVRDKNMQTGGYSREFKRFWFGQRCKRYTTRMFDILFYGFDSS